MRHRSRRPSRLAITLCLAGAALGAARAPVHAAELGDARVLSHIGQQLVADIDLSMIDDPGAPVTARLASADVYSGAGIAMAPVLSSINLSVMRRDGRQYLHVTSLRPVDADHLHLYLELSDKGQRAVRLATLWLTPDPHPAPAAAPVSVPAAVVLPAAPSAPSPAPATAAVSSSAAAPLRLAPPAATAIAVPVAAAVTVARVPAAAMPAPAAPVPARAAAREPAVLPPEGIAPPPRMRRIVLPFVAGKPGAALHAGLPAPSCARAADDAQVCSALGVKNAALREQLGKLEDQVKGLQAALGVSPGAAAMPASTSAVGAASAKVPAGAAAGAASAAASKTATAAPGPAAAAAGTGHDGAAPATKPDAAASTPPPAGTDAAVKAAAAGPHAAAEQGVDAKPAGAATAAPLAPPKPAVPKPIRSIKTLVPHKPKQSPQEEGAPWGWIAAGAALLAAGGAALAWRRHARSRRAAGAAGASSAAGASTTPAPGAPGLLDKLKARFAKPSGQPGAQAAPASGNPAGAEPTLD